MRKFKITTIGKVISFLLAAITLLIFASSIRTGSGITGLNDNWEKYSTGPAIKIDYLQKIGSSIGYGGMIHQFKNYVLRQDTKRIKKIQSKVKAALQQIEAYRAIGVNAKENDALDTITSTIMKYSKAVDIAKKMTQEGQDPRQIDKVIKISDGPALKAISMLNEELRISLKSQSEDVKAAAEKATNFANISATVTIVVLLILLGLVIWFTTFHLGRPIGRLVQVIKKLADGDLSAEIETSDRKDEIGEITDAITVFKDNAIRNRQLETEQEELRTQKELSDAEQNESDEIISSQRKAIVNNLEIAIENMSNGNLEYKITDDFPEEYQKVKDKFNQALSHLSISLGEIRSASGQILAGSGEIHDAASNLAKRTEQQAVTVEQTAAALEETTTAMKTSTERAQEAGTLVAGTKDSAEHSGEIVVKAVSAMGEIEKSSEEIANIIGVIDDIAFQTNLLALNAGVEAARAGESGKGFAVVAQEVRELAQRSASAAKEIKQLITTSSEQVKTGAKLVNETGEALDSIVSGVKEVNEHVIAIVTAANEQSAGLQEINQSINSIDQVTQQNAAVAEQSTAASLSLSEEVTRIDEKLKGFKTRFKERDKNNNVESAEGKEGNSPVHSLTNKVARSFGGAAAAVKDEAWEEF